MSVSGAEQGWGLKKGYCRNFLQCLLHCCSRRVTVGADGEGYGWPCSTCFVGSLAADSLQWKADDQWIWRLCRWKLLFCHHGCSSAQRWITFLVWLPEIPLIVQHGRCDGWTSSRNWGVRAYCLLTATQGQWNQTVRYSTNYSKALVLWFEWVSPVCATTINTSSPRSGLCGT